MIPIASPLIEEEERQAVLAVLNSGRLAQGPVVAQFERAVAAFCGAKHAIAVGNGTFALDLGLKAIGIQPGDEVITTPFTFVATTNAILMQGAIPVFVDIDEKTFNIDPKLIEQKITKKTKAIVPVDLYGQPHDYDEIQHIAKKHNLKVVEDSAQALGAFFNGKSAGLLGDVGAFSFYATKNLTTGEGGVILTNSDEIANLCRILRNQGQDEKVRYEYVMLGYNYRLTELQAALGVEQMKRLDSVSAARIANARLYDEGLKGISWLRTPVQAPNRTHVYHQYTILLDSEINREEFLLHLKKHEIGYGVYYPKPLYDYEYLLKFKSSCPVANSIAKRVVSLPIHPRLSSSDVKKVVEVIRSFK